MSSIPGTLEELFQWIQNGSITIPPHKEPEPKIKPEVISDHDINVLLNEIETPESKIEQVRKLTQEILSLTQEQATEKTSPELSRMLYLTDERAKHIPRFEHIPMVYRDYVGVHSDRIMLLFWLNRWVLFKQIFWDDFNDHYLTLYAKVHDILEGLSPFWDIPTPLKLWLSDRSQEVMDIVERKLWEILIAKIPLSDYWDEYDEAMLEDMITKRSLESQVLSYFDKVDWYITCFHELIAWNKDFLEPFNNYIAIFKDIKAWTKLANLQVLLDWDWEEDKVGHIKNFWNIDSILEQENRLDEFFWKCSTTELMIENIESDFWLPMYTSWKWIGKQIPVISIGDSNLISWEDMVCKRWREIIAPQGLY